MLNKKGKHKPPVNHHNIYYRNQNAFKNLLTTGALDEYSNEDLADLHAPHSWIEEES